MKRDLEVVCWYSWLHISRWVIGVLCQTYITIHIALTVLYNIDTLWELFHHFSHTVWESFISKFYLFISKFFLSKFVSSVNCATQQYYGILVFNFVIILKSQEHLYHCIEFLCKVLYKHDIKSKLVLYVKI